MRPYIDASGMIGRNLDLGDIYEVEANDKKTAGIKPDGCVNDSQIPGMKSIAHAGNRNYCRLRLYMK